MVHPFQQRKLGEILVAKRYATTQQVEAAAAGGGRLGDRLLEEKRITPDQLAEALAEQFRLPYVDLNGIAVPAELFQYISAADAYHHGVAPYRKDGDVLEVVIADPFDYALHDKLEQTSGLSVRLLLAARPAIEAVLKRSQGTAEVLKDVSEEFRLEMIKETEEGKEETVSLAKLGDAASPVVKLVNTMLVAALQKRVSDVHIETYETGIVVKYRIDGVLYPATETLDRRHQSALISRLKVMAELDIAEKRVPQDGRFKLRFGQRDIDFRISIMPSVFGEDVVIRILDKSSITEGIRNLRLESLGMAPEILRAIWLAALGGNESVD